MNSKEASELFSANSSIRAALLVKCFGLPDFEFSTFRRQFSNLTTSREKYVKNHINYLGRYFILISYFERLVARRRDLHLC